jgi:CheY-like chemotaxis protein
MRAARHEANQDVATRPYIAEPDYKRAADVSYRPEVRGHAPMSSAANSNAPGQPQGRSLNVLVAEDNEINQRVIHGNLHKLGHRVTMVGDGRQAVDEALRGKFDVVLMDIHMPELDGVAAMREIRAQLKGDACPPIVAITAHALSGDREHYLEAGMDDYLSKPIRTADLVNVLERIQKRASGLPDATRESTAEHRTAPPTTTHEVRSDARLIDTPILDLEQLEDLRYLTPPPDATNAAIEDATDPVGGLIRLFQRKALERMSLMDGMLARNEWGPLAETSHSLRGASASMGFPRVAILCKDLELAARAIENAADSTGGSNTKPVPAVGDMTLLLEKIRIHYSEAEHAMQSWLASNNNMPSADSMETKA